MDVDRYATSVTVFISKCVGDVASATCPLLNQKPWMDRDIFLPAFKFGDSEALSAGRHDLTLCIGLPNTTSLQTDANANLWNRGAKQSLTIKVK